MPKKKKTVARNVLWGAPLRPKKPKFEAKRLKNRSLERDSWQKCSELSSPGLGSATNRICKKRLDVIFYSCRIFYVFNFLKNFSTFLKTFSPWKCLGAPQECFPGPCWGSRRTCLSYVYKLSTLKYARCYGPPRSISKDDLSRKIYSRGNPPKSLNLF